MDSGSREENASKQESRAPFRFNRHETSPKAYVADRFCVRRIFDIGAILLILLLWSAAPLTAEGLNSRISDDLALTKATVALLAAKDLTTVRNRLDPATGQISDETLRRMADLFGASEPISIETIWSTGVQSYQTGDGSSRIVLEYRLAGGWVVVDAVVKTVAASKQFTRLYLTANTLPLRELNAFHLFGKGPVQYLFLAAWLAAVVITVLAIVIAFRRHAGWRRWVLVLSMPLGLTPTLAVNWNTAQISVVEAVHNSAGYVIPVVAFRYPMALFGHAEDLTTYFYVSAPLVAFGYLIWHWRWSRGRQVSATQADRSTPPA